MVAAIFVAVFLLLLVIYLSGEKTKVESLAKAGSQSDHLPAVTNYKPASQLVDPNQAKLDSTGVPAESSELPPQPGVSVENRATVIGAQVNEIDSDQATSTAGDVPPSSSPNTENTVGQVPQFWNLGSATLSASVGDFIQIASDFNRVWHGSASVSLRAKQPIEPTTTAGVVQVSSAEVFRNGRLRYSGFLWVASIDGNNRASAMIWIRADDAAGQVVAFQNTMGRQRLAYSDWQEVSIVIDIPPDAFSLHYGASLVGNGSFWIDSLSFEEVSNDIPLTSRPFTQRIFNRVPAPNEILRTPANLDFEETMRVPELQ